LPFFVVSECAEAVASAERVSPAKSPPVPFSITPSRSSRSSSYFRMWLAMRFEAIVEPDSWRNSSPPSTSAWMRASFRPPPLALSARSRMRESGIASERPTTPPRR